MPAAPKHNQEETIATSTPKGEATPRKTIVPRTTRRSPVSTVATKNPQVGTIVPKTTRQSPLARETVASPKAAIPNIGGRKLIQVSGRSPKESFEPK